MKWGSGHELQRRKLMVPVCCSLQVIRPSLRSMPHWWYQRELHKAYTNAGRKDSTQDIELDDTCGNFLMKCSGSYHLDTTETELTWGASSLTPTQNAGAKSTGAIETQDKWRWLLTSMLAESQQTKDGKLGNVSNVPQREAAQYSHMEWMVCIGAKDQCWIWWEVISNPKWATIGHMRLLPEYQSNKP